MLTTRCPHCSTVFRVRPEQLSVRGGRVRCGHCQQAFSALSHLEELDDELALPPNQVPAVETPVTAPVPVATPTPPPLEIGTSQPASVPIRAASPAQPFSAPFGPGKDERPAGVVLKGPSPADVRAERMPEIDFDFTGLDDEVPVPEPQSHREPAFSAADLPVAAAVPQQRSESHAANETRSAAPAPYESKIARELGIRAYDPEQEQSFGQTVMLEEPIDLTRMDIDEPDRGPVSLFEEHERQQHASGKALVEDRRSARGAWRWALGTAVLAILALIQLTYVFRTELAREMPHLRPQLEEVCAALGCKVPYPQEASDEKIKIESSEFFADSGGAGRYRLVATIANHVPYAQSWPSLELTVTDRFDIAIARRVLAPAEWLPEAYRDQPAFEAHSEVTANISLDLDKLAASGYRLYVFYP